VSRSNLTAVKIYRLLLSLYPAAFRNEFGGEMQTVFAQVIEDRSREGVTKTLVFCLGEIKDLPRNLYSQHWVETRKEGSPMTVLSETNRIDQQTAPTIDHNPGSWGAAILAGLPHLLIVLIGVASFLHNGGFYQFSQNALAALGISLGLLVAIILLYAWRQKWPLWSASWYGYSQFILLAISTYVIVELDLNQSWRYTNALFLGWIAVWGIGYLYLFFRDRLRALLTIFFLIPFLGVMMLEFIPDPIEGWLFVSLALLNALTAATIVRLGSYRVSLGLVVGVNLVAALALAYIGEYMLLDLPTNAPPHNPQFLNFLALLALYTIVALILIGTPFLIQGVVNYGRRKLLL
jgi:hypothetical protein